MTTAASSTSVSGRNEGGGRLQAILAIAGLALAVAVTVVLVATPASSAGPPAAAAPTRAASAATPALPVGLRVEVQGGAPMDAYALGDRLTAAGASLQGVDPAGEDEAVAARTTIVYYDLPSRPAAETLRSLLGSGTLQRRQVFQPEVDVTIVLGKDLPRL